MTTTALMVEVLIVGVQTAIWILLSLGAIFGHRWLLDLKAIMKGWELPGAIAALGVVYTLGVFVDRVADVLFILIRPHDVLLRSRWISRHARAGGHDQRMALRAYEKRTVQFLEQVRSRVRIARASVVNIPLITVTATAFLLARGRVIAGAAYWDILLVVLVGGTLLTLVAFLALGVLEVTYRIRLDQAFSAWQDRQLRLFP